MPKLHLEGSNRVYFIPKVHRLETVVLCMFVIYVIHIVLLTASLNTAVFRYVQADTEFLCGKPYVIIER